MTELLAPAGCAPRIATWFAPLHEGEPCGDAALALPLDGAAAGQHLLMLVDGLGHGPQAAEAAQRAIATAQRQPLLRLPNLMHLLDEELRETRGAAIGLARVGRRAPGAGLVLDFAGVGNTRALRWRGETLQRLPSQYGVVGGGLPAQVVEQTLDLLPGDWVLMFSDGLSERLTLPAALPEWQRDPRLLCTHLATHWRQGADDMGVLACCWPVTPAAPSEAR